MNWDGIDRRKEARGVSSEIHDLVIRIDANLSNHMKRVDDHIADDNEKFNAIFKKISVLSMYVYVGLGIVFAVEFFVNYLGRKI